MEKDVIVLQETPLKIMTESVPSFEKTLLIAAIRADQTGKSTFPEFLEALWKSGIVQYEVDFFAHTVTYHGARRETYQESYPKVSVPIIDFT